jgi:HSP20 family protein
MLKLLRILLKSLESNQRRQKRKERTMYIMKGLTDLSRRIPIPEEIVPSKIDAKMNNGILQIQLPKVAIKPEEETTKVEVK